MAIQRVEAIVVLLEPSSPTGISHSFARLGPSIRTPSKIRNPAAAADAAALTVSPVVASFAPEL
jgi:hypothetical protein